MKKLTFAEDIEAAAGEEQILQICIESTREYHGDGWHGVPQEKTGVLLSWEEARHLLDYPYDKGYGAEDCHAIYAWTETMLLLVGLYDGATWVQAVPRDPTDQHKVKMVGSG